LSANDLPTRIEVVSALEATVTADPLVLREQNLPEAILTLLEAENARVVESLAAFHVTKQERLTEAYAEYYSLVLDLANRVRTENLLSSPALVSRLRRALVFGVYNPDSEFVKQLAREGETTVPFILELSRAPNGPSKWNAYALIGELFAGQEAGRLTAPLSSSSAASLRAAARVGLADPAPDVRGWAVRAVARARDREAIPLLEQLAKNDPDTSPAGYSVRSLAADALRRLR
jgi:hypothetical protein